MPRHKFKPTHGLTSTPTYRSWLAMKTRCTNPNVPSYRDYGARGIKVCERWMSSFENFLADMGERPEGTTLDRVDNNKGYFLGNCRWATVLEQHRNTSANVFIEFNGERLTQAEWAKRIGIRQATISRRINKGWSIKEALTLEPRLGLKRHPMKRGAGGRFLSKAKHEVDDS